MIEVNDVNVGYPLPKCYQPQPCTSSKLPFRQVRTPTYQRGSSHVKFLQPLEHPDVYTESTTTTPQLRPLARHLHIEITLHASVTLDTNLTIVIRTNAIFLFLRTSVEVNIAFTNLRSSVLIALATLLSTVIETSTFDVTCFRLVGTKGLG
jgi:hypothetical protein